MFSQKSSLTFDYYMLKWCENRLERGYDETKFGTTLTGTPLHESPYYYKFGWNRDDIACR